jgi:hypothetical protein
VPGLLAASALYTLAPFLGIVSLITFSNEVISPAVIVAPGLLTSVLPPGMIVLVGSTPVIAVASTMTALSAVLSGLPGFSTMTALFALPPRGIRCAHGAAVELVRRGRGAGSARCRGYEEHSPHNSQQSCPSHLATSYSCPLMAALLRRGDESAMNLEGLGGAFWTYLT